MKDFKPQIPHVDSEHFIDTFAWYFAQAHWIEGHTYGRLLAQNPHRYAPAVVRITMNPGPNVDLEHKILFQVERKSNRE